MFSQSVAGAHDKAAPIRPHRRLAWLLGQVMDEQGLAPSALTPDGEHEAARAAPSEGTMRSWRGRPVEAKEGWGDR
ncbi:hypothetical protein, partial [Paracoccus sp. SY]|uniref:hypothetical protein n=1 Tax=Paracoccus sp. SY TaxID=1330255 RepID=UPI0019616138